MGVRSLHVPVAARQGACAVNSRGGLYSSGRAPPGPHRERRTEHDLKKKPRVNQELTRRERRTEQDLKKKPRLTKNSPGPHRERRTESRTARRGAKSATCISHEAISASSLRITQRRGRRPGRLVRVPRREALRVWVCLHGRVGDRAERLVPDGGSETRLSLLALRAGL